MNFNWKQGKKQWTDLVLNNTCDSAVVVYGNGWREEYNDGLGGIGFQLAALNSKLKYTLTAISHKLRNKQQLTSNNSAATLAVKLSVYTVLQWKEKTHKMVEIGRFKILTRYLSPFSKQYYEYIFSLRLHTYIYFAV